MSHESGVRPIERRVDWITVGDRWCRLSIMGTDLSPEALNREPRNEGKDNRTVFVMIPGNPGNEGLYAEFGEILLTHLMLRDRDAIRTYQMFTISYLNHVKLPAELARNYEGGNMSNERFNLEDQIEHKLRFMKECVPKAEKVYLIGHSIGAYVMLKILSTVVEEFNVCAAIALFPTIERMSESPNGMKMQRLFSILNARDWLVKGATFWIDYLPISVKKWFVCVNHRSFDLPQCLVDSGAELLNVTVIRNIVHLVHDTLGTVRELDESLLKEKKIIHLFYGSSDGWTPREYEEKMNERLGMDHVHSFDCEHDFVVRDSRQIVEKIIPFIV